jgi:hypothetical protein
MGELFAEDETERERLRDDDLVRDGLGESQRLNDLEFRIIGLGLGLTIVLILSTF